ncbi:MAG TPA: TIGR03668 family PPOX class F420-dependent oxidoreductase [Blastocatellia bacterium]|jgi:PPOX class probable F420-dependent enzyme
MRPEIDESTREFINRHRVARLATADLRGRPAVVPICYAFDGEKLYSPIDEKPKSVEARSLRRARNIESNPSVSVLIDDYSEDWSKLEYVLITARATLLAEGDAGHARAVGLLREKYPQYLSMHIESGIIISIEPVTIKRWDATTR